MLLSDYIYIYTNSRQCRVYIYGKIPVRNILIIFWNEDGYCCTPYIMDSPSYINTCQRERQKELTKSAWHNHVWYYLPTPPLGQDMTQGQFLSGVLQVWIQSFPSPRQVASPRLKNLVCPNIFPIAGGRIIGFIPFPRVFVLCEMPSISSRIWTRVAVFISYDDNDYTTGTSNHV